MNRAKLNKQLEFVENFGAFCWPVFSNIYLVVGKKRVEGITPLKASWRQRRRVVAGWFHDGFGERSDRIRNADPSANRQRPPNERRRGPWSAQQN